MKIRTQLIMAAALLALAVPAAANAAASKAPATGSTKPAAAPKPIGSKKVPKPTLVKPPAPKLSSPSVGFVTAPAVTQPVVESQQQVCQKTGMGCTDQQYCDFWNIACASTTNGDTTSGPTVNRAELLSELEDEYCCDPIECMSFA